LPKSGFVPGESIPITIEIDNKTTKEVEKVTAKLNKTVRYRAQRKKEKGFWNSEFNFKSYFNYLNFSNYRNKTF
jgi:hypothetical protein